MYETYYLSRNSARAPSLTVNTYSSYRSTPDLTLFPFAAGSRNEWNMNSTVSKLTVHFWVKHASLLHLVSQRKQWYSSSLTERLAVFEKWAAKWSLGLKLTFWTLMFTCWRLEAKWWRLSVVFFVCYSSINTVLINNVAGAQCSWLSWGLIPNCQYCTDEAPSMCMLGFLALWASLCMSV